MRAGSRIAQAMSYCVAAVAIAWLYAAFPAIWGSWSYELTGNRIMVGERFKIETLRALATAAESRDPTTTCSEPFLKGLLLVNARLVEASLDGAPDRIPQEARLSNMENSAIALLRCSPYQSFGWLALYWTRGHLSGFTPSLLPLLAMSYKTAPQEGWIAFRRNDLAIRVLDQLPGSLQDQVIEEWVSLVKAYLYEPAERTILRAPASIRERLLARHHQISSQQWHVFARRLDRGGIPEELPGIARAPYRPWR